MQQTKTNNYFWARANKRKWWRNGGKQFNKLRPGHGQDVAVLFRIFAVPNRR